MHGRREHSESSKGCNGAVWVASMGEHRNKTSDETARKGRADRDMEIYGLTDVR